MSDGERKEKYVNCFTGKSMGKIRKRDKMLILRIENTKDGCSSPIFARFILLFIYVCLYVLVCD